MKIVYAVSQRPAEAHLEVFRKMMPDKAKRCILTTYFEMLPSQMKRITK